MRERSSLRSVVYEAHPELAFARMNKGNPVLSKKSKADGIAERLALLAQHDLHPELAKLPGAKTDDILDAVACYRTALLISRNEATCLGPARERDRYGLPMNIWY